MISLIYARSLDHCIGDRGIIPWHLPDDFAHFENTTSGKPIIMGRKTYEDHNSALPDRLNIVISSQDDYQTAPGVVLMHSLHEALTYTQQQSKDVFVIGGVSFFNAALPLATVVYETIVDATIAGDTILPDYDFSDWASTLLQDHPIDEDHQFAFKIYRHQRVGPALISS